VNGFFGAGIRTSKGGRDIGTGIGAFERVEACPGIGACEEVGGVVPAVPAADAGAEPYPGAGGLAAGAGVAGGVEAGVRFGAVLGEDDPQGVGGKEVSGPAAFCGARDDARRFGGGVPPAERGISDAGGFSGVSDSSLMGGQENAQRGRAQD
jgi:hypothetical protein